MAVNNLTFNQVSTLLAEITEQATGQKTIAPVDTSEFVSVATTALKAGHDVVLNAISQVLARTIFSIRPYEAKFGGLRVSSQQYGAITRKLQVVDKPFENDDRYLLTDGQSVDQYKINKPEVIQTNFYGANVFQKSLTIFRDQLDMAFSGPDQFGEFMTMVTTNALDMIAQANENLAREALVNFIGAKVHADVDVFHLVTEYNDETGLQLDSDTVLKPENFVPFAKWAYAFIKTVSQKMTNRGTLFHTNLTGKNIMRHTPASKQKMYMLEDFENKIDAMVLSSVYNDEYMKMLDHESVTFWQSIDQNSGIDATVNYLDVDGTIKQAANVTKSNIIGVLFDEEALGYTIMHEWSAMSPFNARGGYWNQFWHMEQRYWNDFTENGCVFILD